MPTLQSATPNRNATFVFQVLAVFLPMALLACGAAYYFYYNTQERAAILNRARETVGIELGQSAISHVLQETRRDIRLISEHHSLKNYLDQPAQGEMRDFEQDMLNLASASRFYDQIRWLDETGMERMRVNYNNGMPMVTPDKALQNKHARYYFPAAFKLKRGETYMSPLDLNIEHDRIEIPHKPMLRIATPVFDGHGDKRGIVILNYLGAELLAHFDKATTDIAGHVMLLNQDGYWLKSPHPDEAWGFMFGRDQLTLARRHPAAWQRILAADSGQFEDADGLWTFNTLYPGLEGQKTPDRASFWKAVAHLPQQALYGSHPLLMSMLIALASILLLQFAVSWKLVRARRLRNEAQDQVRHTNRNLERLVEERTAQLQADIDLRKQVEGRLRLQSAALEAAANAIVIADTEGFIQWANPAYFRLIGYTLEESIGKRPKDLIKSGLQDQAFWEAFWQTIKSGQVWHGEVVNKRKGGLLYTEEMTVTPVRDEQGELAHFIAVKEDISTRKRLEQRQLAQILLLEKAAGDMPLTALLEELIRFIEEQAPELRCSILLADETRGVLRHGAAPSLPDAYNRLVDGLPIAEGNGSCGTASARRETVIVSDVRNDPLWAHYQSLVTGQEWLRACWSTPFFDSKGKLLGTFGVYAAEPRTPSSAESDLIDYAVALAGLVTERKQAEDALRERESMLSESQRIAHVGSWQTDLPTGNLTWSEETYRIYEVSPETFTHTLEAFYALVHADDRAAMQEWGRACVAGEHPGELEFRTVLNDGNVRVLSGRGDVRYDADKRPIRMVGTVQDITERKRVEQRLLENDQFLNTVIESEPECLKLLDAKNRLLRMNPAGLNAIEADSSSQVIGKNVLEIVAPEYRDDFAALTKRVFAGESGELEFEIIGLKGTRRWMNTHAVPLRDARGEISAYLAISRDITGRKGMEEKLRTLSTAIEQAPISVVITDLNANLQYVNPRFTEATGYSVDEAIGQNPRILQSSLTPKATYQAMWKSLTHGQIWHGELINRRKNGEIYWEDAHIAPVFDATGATTHYVGVKLEITERKKAELRILNLNRVYTVLSNINQAIVRLRDMDMLFCEVCRIAVEDGGFRMAWIGMPDPADGQLRPVARFGMTGDYLDDIHISLDNGERGRGPTGIAFREGRHVCCNDIEHDPCMEPWRERALGLGYRGSIAIPLKVKGVVRGVYNLYASQADFFNDEEIKLLDELADDIGFTMEMAETEAERSHAEERLRQAAAVFENTREGIMVTDVGLHIRLVNRAFSEVTGYTEAEVLDKKPSVLSSGRHDRDFYTTLWATLNADGHWQGEIWNRRKSGEIYPELLSISAITDDAGQVTGYVGVFADIAKLKASESELEFLAHHDPLTRLPNRLLLLSRLEHGIGLARRENRQLALLMLDLDRFKDVNDSFGHLAGDELLQQAAVRLTERLRDVDTVTRLGGDEFTVLLEDIARPEDAARVAEEIIVALSEPWHLANGVEVRIGVSIGISLFPQHGNSAAELLQQADAALYQAKAEGRSRFTYFSEHMTHAARQRIKLETRLRRAITQNELRIHYQPQVDIATGRIIGAEALVRWQDPLEGLIPPDRFIPVAEATGLISAIGEWVLNETCLQGQRWTEAGLPPLTLAVNVSPRQFSGGDLVDVVSRTLAATGFPAACLELELTESALMERQQEAVDMLNRLRAIGVRLAIDDFGTGYSSLAYLKRFPLDVLKIDKSFIDDIPGSEDDEEIAAAIVVMAHTLRFKVLAEGVETVEQLAFLQNQGCDSYQGYLKSPPLPPDAFARLLAESGLE